MATFNAIFNLEDRMSDRLNRINQNLESARQHLENNNNILNQYNQTSHGFFQHHNSNWQQHQNMINANNTAMRGFDYTLQSVTRRLSQSRQAMTLFNGATNPHQAMMGFNSLEQAIRQSRLELSRLGFGRTAMEVRAVEGQLYNFANVRFRNLRDEISRTERALNEMRSSPNASQYQSQIDAAEQALTGYRRRLLEESDAVRQMAQLNGYRVARLFGKDVIYKPFNDTMSRITGRLDRFMNRDIGYMANAAYQSIDRSIKRMIGATDGVMDERQKIMGLQNAYMMMGTTLNTMVTPAILMAVGAMGMLSNLFEDANIKFSQMTLTPQVNTGQYKDMIDELFIEMGNPMQEINSALARNKNLGVSDDKLQLYTEQALELADAWGASGVAMVDALHNAEQSFNSRDVAGNAMAMAMKRTHGNIQEATEDLSVFKDMYTKLANGKKVDLAEVEARASAIAETKFKRVNPVRRQKEIQNYVNSVKASFEELNSIDGANALNLVMDAEGPIDTFIKAVKALGVMIKNVFNHLGPMIQAVSEKILQAAKAIDSFNKSHPALAKTVAYFTAFALASVVLIGALAPLAFLLVRFRGTLQLVAQGIALMHRGTVVANPQLVMMGKTVKTWRNAIIGMPRLLMALFPTLITLARLAPMAIGKFVLDFIKMNPLLLALAGIAYLIYREWERVGPLFKRIADAFKLAVKPLKDFFAATKESQGSGFMDLLTNVADTLGNALVNALEIVVPLIEAFAHIMNGDYDKATKSMNKAIEGISGLFTDFFKDFDFEGAFDFGVDLATAIVNGMKTVFQEGFTQLVDFNKEAFKSGEPSKIATALAADAIAMYGTMLLGSAVLRTALKGGKGIKNTVTGVRNAGSAVANTGRNIATGTRNAYNVITNPRALAQAINTTRVGDVRAGYRLMREEGAGRVRSLFGGYNLASGGPQVNNAQIVRSAVSGIGSKIAGIGSKAFQMSSKLALPVSLAAGGYKIAKAEEGTERQKTVGGVAGSIAGGLAGAKGGAIAGGSIGTFIGGPAGTAIGGAIGGVVGGVGGSIVGGIGGEKIGAKWEEIKSGAKKVTTSIGDFFKNAWNTSGESLGQLKDSATKKFDEIKENVKTKATEMKDNFVAKVNELKGKTITFLSELPSKVGAFATQMAYDLGYWIGYAVEWGKGKFGEFIDWCQEIPDRIGAWFSTLGDKIGVWIDSAVTWGKTKFDEFVQWGLDLPDRIAAWFSTLGDKIGVWIDIAVQWGIDKFNALIDWFVAFPENAYNTIVGLPDTLAEIWESVKTGAKTKFDEIITSLESTITSIPSKIASFGTMLLEAGKTIGKSIVDGLVAGWNSAWGGLSSVAKWAIDKASSGASATWDFVKNMGGSFTKGYEDGKGAKKAKNANGGFVNPLNPDGGRVTRSTLVAGGNGIAGEAGAEMIIPLGASRRNRALELFNKTADYLGVSRYANGGVTGGGTSDVANAVNNTGGGSKGSEGNVLAFEQLIGQIIIQKPEDIEALFNQMRDMLMKQLLGGGDVAYDD